MRRTTVAGVALLPIMLATGVFAGHAAAAGGGPNAPMAGKATGVSAAATTVPARVFAVVNTDGTKLRGKAVASTARLGTGLYDVRFNRNISTCAWTGTVGTGTFVGSTGQAEISVSGRSGTNNGLFVETFSGSATADLPFTVLVVCS
jgi:hypothetical protein